MKNKRGLSTIVATVLIVLLALAAISVIWYYINNVLVSTGESIDLAQRCLQTEVRPTGCSATEGTVQVQYLSGNATQVIGIIKDVDGTTNSDAESAPGLLATVTTTPGLTGISGATTASAAAVVSDPENPSRTLICDESPTTITCT